jgi:hypothetical protein
MSDWVNIWEKEAVERKKITAVTINRPEAKSFINTDN